MAACERKGCGENWEINKPQTSISVMTKGRRLSKTPFLKKPQEK